MKKKENDSLGCFGILALVFLYHIMSQLNHIRHTLEMIANQLK